MDFERKLVRLNTVKEMPLEWIWTGRILVGGLTLVEGDPAQGKSRLMYDILARVSKGLPMPGENVGQPPAGAVIVQGEDDPARTVRPVLSALGADLKRVVVYDPTEFGSQPLSLPDDLILLRDAVEDVGAKILILDPVTMFIAGNPNADVSVRRALTPLADLARNLNVAIVMVKHLRKGGGPLLSQGAGSMAWIAAARVGLRAISDPTTNDPHRHLLLQVKTNLTAVDTWAYRTRLSEGQVVPEWLKTVDVTARELDAGGSDCEHSRLNEAIEVLFFILQKSAETANEVLRKAREEGQSQRTIERAKKRLGVVTYRAQFSTFTWHWMWRLPEHPNPTLAALLAKYAPPADPASSAGATAGASA